MRQEDWNAWVRIFRDIIIVGLGTFMLIFETVFKTSPNLDVLAVGAALLGLPPVLRLDVWSSGGNGNGNGRRRRSRRDEDDDERWSHLP